MDYINLDRRFSEYILNLVGPNPESNKNREEKFNTIKNLILKTFENDDTFYPHIYCFGSFPLNTYLQDSDLDITVIFEDKPNNCIIYNNMDNMNKYNILI